MVAECSLLVDQFVEDAKEDVRSPTTSTFNAKVAFYRQQMQNISENLDFDLDGLTKLKKCVKLLYEAGQEWHKCEQDLVVALDQIAGLNAANSLVQDVEPDISAAWLKFCVIFKDLSVLTRSLVQSVKNNLVFPIDNLLKSADVKDKYDFKKGVDKAFKEYDAKLSKCEKQHKNSPLLSHVSISSPEMAENLAYERTILQYELCKFFMQAGKLRGRKGTELLQHLIDFYHTQESFYREGLRTVEEFRCYVAELIEKLNDVKRKQEDDRKRLRDLAETLEKSPYIRDYNRSQRISDSVPPTNVPPAIVYSTEPSSSATSTLNSFFGGYLWKKSSNKMHKSWLRRKCQVRHGYFYMWHSDESLAPAQVNLMVCQIKSDKNDKKCFDIVSYERVYHFQADDEQLAANWLFALARNRENSQQEAFNDERSAHDEKITSAIERIKSLPGNDKCCDCHSDKDVVWVSVNLGSLHCIDCSGIHRELGVHVSRIQSLDLDHADAATLLIPLSLGNKAVNEIYEATIDVGSKRFFTVKNNMRKNFVVSKYVEKKFVKHVKHDELAKSFSDSAADGCMSTLLRCFAAGVDLNMILDEDVVENALFTAVRNDVNGSHLAYIHFLVQNGIDVNRVNMSGDTAVHLAVRLNKPNCLKLVLLSRNLRLLTNSGEETAKQLARRLNGENCERLINKIELNDRSSLGDVDFPPTLLPLTVSVKHVAESPTAETSPRGGLPPPPPPPTAKPHVPEIHGDSNHRRTVSDVTFDSNSTSPPKRHLPPGAKLVLPPMVEIATPPKKTQNLNLSQSLHEKRPMVNQRPRESVLNSSASSYDTGSSAENLAHAPPPKPAPRQKRTNAAKPTLKRCRALYECNADNVDELSFKKGDIIIVTRDRMREEEDNWLEGYLECDSQRVGLFPVTFVTFEK